jgi:CBS domain-containing protein
MEKKIILSDIMTKDVISAHPADSVVDAAKIIADNHFDGLPVVDDERKLVGIVTEYDLVIKGPAIHLPTFQYLLRNLPIPVKDEKGYRGDVQTVLDLKIQDVMNKDPMVLSEDATYEEVVAKFSEHHRVNPIPVLDKNRKVVGVVSRFDVLKPLRSVFSSQ